MLAHAELFTADLVVLHQAGVVTVDFGASAATVVTVEITDSFGNVGSDAL